MTHCANIFPRFAVAVSRTSHNYLKYMIYLPVQAGRLSP